MCVSTSGGHRAATNKPSGTTRSTARVEIHVKNGILCAPVTGTSERTPRLRPSTRHTRHKYFGYTCAFSPSNVPKPKPHTARTQRALAGAIRSPARATANPFLGRATAFGGGSNVRLQRANAFYEEGISVKVFGARTPRN